MIITGFTLHQLIDMGVITAKHENVNGCSIDITLGDSVMVEYDSKHSNTVDLSAKESVNFHEVPLGDGQFFDLKPNEFILTHSSEVFNLPSDISCIYYLKSSLARNGLEHLKAGFCDAGWNNATLTMEFKNVNQFHTLRLKAGMKIGQMIFIQHQQVPPEQSYATKGQYNNQDKPQVSKGLR